MRKGLKMKKMKMYFKKFDYARVHYSGHKSEFKEKRDREFRHGVAVRQVLTSPAPVFRAVDTNIYFVLCDDGGVISACGQIGGEFEGSIEEKILFVYLERGINSAWVSQRFSVNTPTPYPVKVMEIARDFYFVRGEPVILIKGTGSYINVCRYREK